MSQGQHKGANSSLSLEAAVSICLWESWGFTMEKVPSSVKTVPGHLKPAVSSQSVPGPS